MTDYGNYDDVDIDKPKETKTEMYDPIFPKVKNKIPEEKREETNLKPKPLPQANPGYYPIVRHEESFFKKVMFVIGIGLFVFFAFWMAYTFSHKDFTPQNNINVEAPNVTTPVNVNITNHYNLTIEFNNATIEDLAKKISDKINFTNST